MIIKQFTSLFFFIIVFSCTTQDNSRTYQLAKTSNPPTINKNLIEEERSKKLIWEKPDSWIPSEGSSMRLVSFSVPYSFGLGDLSVIKLEGDGGGLLSNINRWRRQLNLDPLNIDEIEKNIVNMNGKLGSYKIIQIQNEETDNAFLCAILPLVDKTIFVKLSLNPKGITEVENDFISFCSSLNILK